MGEVNGLDGQNCSERVHRNPRTAYDTRVNVECVRGGFLISGGTIPKAERSLCTDLPPSPPHIRPYSPKHRIEENKRSRMQGRRARPLSVHRLAIVAVFSNNEPTQRLCAFLFCFFFFLFSKRLYMEDKTLKLPGGRCTVRSAVRAPLSYQGCGL